MTILLVVPALPAHYDIVAALGQPWRAEGHRVLVATGAALAERAEADGFEHRRLELGGADDPAALDVPAGLGNEALQRRFVEASRRGMLAALRYHASWQQQASVFEPLSTTLSLARILEEEEPDLVLVDQFAHAATLGLRALGRPWVGVCVHHPWSSPDGRRPYGYPSVRPAEMRAEAPGLLHLHQTWTEAAEHYTGELNRLLQAMNPDAALLDSAWEGAPLLNLFVYPESMGAAWWDRLPERSAFVGTALPAPVESGEDVPGSEEPTVLVTLGDRLSARTDVLSRITEALRRQRLRVLLETGATVPQRLGEIPDGWIVAPSLSRPAALSAADLVIGHAGNDLITAALARGVPLLVAPFAADQYAGAADVRRAGVGEVFDPDHADAADIAVLALGLLQESARARARRVGREMAAEPGPRRAMRLCTALLDGDRAQVA